MPVRPCLRLFSSDPMQKYAPINTNKQRRNLNDEKEEEESYPMHPTRLFILNRV